MSKHVAFLSVVAAVLGAAALPGAAAAADYFDGGDRPYAFHGRDDVDLDGGRARILHGRDLRPAEDDFDRRAPGPVVFDERGPDRRYGRFYGYGAPGYRRPLVPERPAFDDERPVAFVPRVERPYGAGNGYGYRPASIARPEPVFGGPAFAGGHGGPDLGCTIQQVQSTTPLGWRKVVTHRTCYRR